MILSDSAKDPCNQNKQDEFVESLAPTGVILPYKVKKQTHQIWKMYLEQIKGETLLVPFTYL